MSETSSATVSRLDLVSSDGRVRLRVRRVSHGVHQGAHFVVRRFVVRRFDSRGLREQATAVPHDRCATCEAQARHRSPKAAKLCARRYLDTYERGFDA